MKPLENFFIKNPPKKRVSKLKKYENEIMEMYEKNYKVEQIQEFLKTQNVEISVIGIYKFLQKQEISAATETATVQNNKKPNKPNKAMARFLQKVKGE